jgi:poly-gamma-glutamate biosynthesis protein PgsC/CapC
MVIGLILTESVGVTAGGIIVPGYIALHLHHPYLVAVTFLISLTSVLLLNILSRFMIIYGKRRFIFCILLAFFVGAVIRELPAYWLVKEDLYLIQKFIIWLNESLSKLTGYEMIFIGYLIPGLIASWMDRQGIVITISTIIITSSFINLMLIVVGAYV